MLIMKLDFNRYTSCTDPKKAIIAIHGWGGNKDSFSPFFNNLKINNVEWFSPEGPYLVKENSSESIIDKDTNVDSFKKSWTYKKDDGSWEIEEPMIMMDSFFNDIIFKEYESKNVYVLGFSQGAAVCYEYIIGMARPLGGVFPIGGFLFKYSNKQKRVSESNKRTPIIIGHGIKDEVIPIEKSEIAYNQLLSEGADVKFHKYNGGHKISMDFLRIVKGVINGS